ncbi:phosphoribosyltransferase [Oricola sp.]|uniref:phosphoribosyltransferase n=1 Tax=Oricola sp. TaxID=1979950 RepID=UPI003BAD6150
MTTRTDVWQEIHDGLVPGVQPDGESFAADFGGGKTLLLPLRRLPGDAGNHVASLIVTQASFVVLDALADRISEALATHRPEVIVGVPTLGLPLAEAVARRLGHTRLVPLSTSRKFWYDEAQSMPISSVTSPGEGKRIYMDPRMIPLLQDRRVAVVDDVLSTGRSMRAVLDLLDLADVAPVMIGAAMLQGDGWREAVGEVPAFGAISTPIVDAEALQARARNHRPRSD